MQLIALADIDIHLRKRRTSDPLILQTVSTILTIIISIQIEKYLEKRVMKSQQLLVLISIILLGGCTAFFQKVSGLDEIEKVAIVSILLDTAESALPESDITDQAHSSQNALPFNSQALLEFAYTQLQNQIETQLHWQADTDVRHKPLGDIDNAGYEGLHGVSLLPASSVYALSSGSSPAPATRDYIKELCRQLDVDAIVMMGIDLGPRKKGLLNKFKKEQGMPSVLLNLAAVDSQGQVILNTEHFNEEFSVRSLSKKTPTNAQLLDAYKVAINNTLVDYFYRSAVIFKRMGYQLSKVKGIPLGDRAKQPIEPGSASVDSDAPQAEKPPTRSTTPLRTTRSATQPSEAKTIKTIDDSKKNEQETSDVKPTRRSIWSIPEEPSN